MTNQSERPTMVAIDLDNELLQALLVAPHGPLAQLTVLDSVESTNTFLAQMYAATAGQLSLPAVVVARDQTGGKGRSGRQWVTPAGSALTASLMSAAGPPLAVRSWLPLVAGLAVVTALRSTLGVTAVAKWPNDILVPTQEPDLPGWLHLRKLGGILVEAVDQETVIIGLGLNVSMNREQLPVATATSLEIIGCQNQDRNMLLASFAAAYMQILATWREHDWDITDSGLLAELTAVSATIGAQVRAELTGGQIIVGTAVGFAGDGGLEVLDEGGETHVIRSGDVYHLRLH